MKELTISGVKTNVGFLINVLNHPTFVEGKCTTNFIEENDELFKIFTKTDREYNLLKYIGEKVVNETFGVKKEFDVPVIPKVIVPDGLKGTKQILDEKGPKGLVDWIKSQEKLLITDTTMRDAHQSLMATRMRSIDMIKVAK